MGTGKNSTKTEVMTLQTSTGPSAPFGNQPKREKQPSVKFVLLIWILLIVLGIGAAYLYSNHVKQEMINQLQASTENQMNDLKKSYEAQFNELAGQVKELESKVQSFNELLTFTKDNATSKTDNSNKLYTQLNEVKKQLDTLQKKMDLLK
ncbi:hypothetical protein J43TS9_38120 [Paenibacillus cineris]|nr:hypothetical protein J43TS9_38120 [Paenibacillus cineris]